MSTFVGNGGKLDEQGYMHLFAQLFTAGYAQRTDDAWAVSDPGNTDMTVDVAAGAGFIAYGELFGYPAWSDAVENVAVPAADATNDRIDTVVAYVDRDEISTDPTNNPDALIFTVVEGTPGSSPAAPSDGDIQTAVGADNPYYPIADLLIEANSTTVPDNNITDRREPINFRGGLEPGQAGVLGPAGIRTGTSSYTSEAALPGLTQTVTVPDAPGRFIEIEAYLPNVKNDNSTTRAIQSIRLRRNNTGGTLYQGASVELLAQQRTPVHMKSKPLEIGVDIAPGEYTFVVTASQSVGTGQLLGSTLGTAWIAAKML